MGPRPSFLQAACWTLLSASLPGLGAAQAVCLGLETSGPAPTPPLLGYQPDLLELITWLQNDRGGAPGAATRAGEGLPPRTWQPGLVHCCHHF